MNSWCLKMTYDTRKVSLLTQGDSDGKVNIKGNDSIGYCDKKFWTVTEIEGAWGSIVVKALRC